MHGLLEDRRINRPTYLDIGAFLPDFGSNTYLLYLAGGRGVLVEPNVDLIPRLRSVRPRDAVLEVGIGLGAQERADYYRLSMIQLNTFDQEQANKVVSASGGQVSLVGVGSVRLMPINRVLAEHFPNGGPDFLSIDVEGLDLSILKTMDFDRFRPSILCRSAGVANPYDGRRNHRVPQRQGLFVRTSTLANTIYERSPEA